MVQRSFLPRTVLIAGILILGLSACGRRGALEPPPDPNAVQTQQSKDGTSASQGALPSPVGTPREKTVRKDYTRPKTPFILDPLL